PPDLKAAYLANVASREDDARAVLTKIELGEGDAGIVYATDAVASTVVSEIAIPVGAQVTAVYAGVVIAGSREREAAHAFLDWLRSATALAILAEFGFEAPP
ncbi:MAG: modA, partial [Chloroflexi bacterium]|nr:modA [Chloroflexota bacterium]